MNYCKLHSFVGSEQDSKDCSECHIEREKEIPFLANLKTVISPDKVRPKYDADYEEWKDE